MIVQKAGTILLHLENKQIGLVYRQKKDDYSFPKGHLEKGERLMLHAAEIQFHHPTSGEMLRIVCKPDF